MSSPKTFNSSTDPSRPSRIVALSVSETGRSLADRLPFEHFHGTPGPTLRALWQHVDGVVMVLAVGAAVRLIAPLLTSKDQDPAVVCLDDNGRWAVALAGGHAGGPTSRVRTGANELAHKINELIGAQAVVTTASDGADLPSLDKLPGLCAQGDLSGVGAALIDGRGVEIINSRNWPLSEALVGATEQVVDPRSQPRTQLVPPAARIVVTDELSHISSETSLGRFGDLEAGDSPADALTVGNQGHIPTAILHPASLVAGIGASSDATREDSEALLSQVLKEAGLTSSSIAGVATIDSRAQHPSVSNLGFPVISFSAKQLASVAVANPSSVVQAAVGTPSVAEAAALLAAGPHAELVVGKQRANRVTVAIARRIRPPGSLSIVGLGPGTAWHRTPAAEVAVRDAQVVVGYTPYVSQASALLSPHQKLVPLPIGAEAERARIALDEATRGQKVALLCSGDAGVYGMAAVTLEILEHHPSWPVSIEVIPGVTAALAAAATLGAPLGHDYLTISLSDLHTPWDVIAARIKSAGETDLVVVIYNPRSHARHWQLDKARDILRRYRPGSTPVGLATNVGRPEQQVKRTTLDDLDTSEVGMTTTVIVGSSSTRVVNGFIVTPRGLPDGLPSGSTDGLPSGSAGRG